MYHSLHCRETAKVRAQSCSEEYDKLFIAASTTEGQPRIVLTAALRNIMTYSERPHMFKGASRVSAHNCPEEYSVTTLLNTAFTTEGPRVRVSTEVLFLLPAEYGIF
jgi:hypothetical protein